MRVMQLLTNISPYHTKECTRNAQPLYEKQVIDRYAPLIGHKPPPSSSWFTSIFADDDSDSHASKRLQTTQHKYYFAINLYNSFDVIPDLFAVLFRVSAILDRKSVV